MQQKLLTQIAIALKSRSEISLLELIEIYPIDCGMEEVVAYLEIAQQPPHTIDNDVKDAIEVTNVLQGSQMKTTMPRIVFRRQT
ncbi:DUF3375 family protein [Chamaesiphon polymorphus]|uniref:Uncharacterized protein n=1 Tax=Chamaesiphon polymorphus CCALA 037 TaxID=2107692 RepID=A0A2T1F8G4_9CYAN|nr:DUF3375 family protein [Chamaesiphon polymorphus]PSB41198.1 hypothetical protein C7B77_27605 [Chamaesiphon polymorphus CCALA 037]